jgi:hypothetical protein
MTMVVRLRLDPAAEAGMLGIWSDEADPTDITFSTPTDVEHRDAEAVWQVHLPAEEASAWRLLDHGQQVLERTRNQVTGLPAAVDGWFSDRTLHDQGVEIAFSVETRTVEQEVEDAVEKIGQLVRVGAPTAWVETHVAEQLLARSRISVAGDLTTVVFAADRGDSLAGHERSLALVTASRIAAVRAAAATVRAAAAIAARLSLPGGPLLALPLAWRLLRHGPASPARAGVR